MKILYTGQFKKDYKRMKKRGKDMSLLHAVISTLTENIALESKYKDHPLRGSLSGYRECHIESDWLLMYKKNSDSLTVARTGTHADLFV